MLNSNTYHHCWGIYLKLLLRIFSHFHQINDSSTVVGIGLCWILLGWFPYEWPNSQNGQQCFFRLNANWYFISLAHKVKCSPANQAGKCAMWVKFMKTESNEEAMSYFIRMYKLIQKYLLHMPRKWTNPWMSGLLWEVPDYFNPKHTSRQSGNNESVFLCHASDVETSKKRFKKSPQLFYCSILQGHT